MSSFMQNSSNNWQSQQQQLFDQRQQLIEQQQQQINEQEKKIAEVKYLLIIDNRDNFWKFLFKVVMERETLQLSYLGQKTW